jgi:hypothetical protein
MRKYMAGLLCLLLFGCELIVDIDVPFEHAQLTVNALFPNDSLWTAAVSLNRHVLNDSPFQKVENALVVLYQNNSPIDTLVHKKDGVYRSDTGKPVAGIQYEIRVSAEKYESVAAHSYIPVSVPITSVETSPGRTTDGRSVTTFHLKFKDDPAVQNYYQIIMDVASEYIDQKTGLIHTSRNHTGIESSDPTLQSENMDWYDGIFLKDILFNGKEVEVSFNNANGGYENSGWTIITLYTVSEDYYKYKTTAQLQHNTSGDPFAQPVNVFNNIEHGFGIFAGYSQSVYSSTGPKPEITSISPMKGEPGDHFIITGKNFSTNNYSVSHVLFPGKQNGFAYARTVSSSDSQMEVIIPADAKSGKIYISTGGRIIMSEDEFEVTN